MVDRGADRRALLERAILAFILPGVAGAINASGFFAVGAYTSHVTGTVARVGDELASGHLWLATRSGIFIGAFFLGALASSLLILYGKRAGGSPYWRPLLVECALLLVFATVNVGSEPGANLNGLEMTALLCFAMGLQNALVTKLSGARIRTTHLTGITTDIGIEAARVLDHWRHGGQLPSLWSDPDLKRLRSHVAIFGSFLAGATLGPLGYIHFGHIAMLLPCAVLLGLAAFDGWVGLSARSFGATESEPNVRPIKNPPNLSDT
jgi:uncharacterized membrane protein YoaK (UPF0700 family)